MVSVVSCNARVGLEDARNDDMSQLLVVWQCFDDSLRIGTYFLTSVRHWMFGCVVRGGEVLWRRSL